MVWNALAVATILRLRPALIFQPRHAAEFLQILEHSVQELKNTVAHY